MKKSFTILVIFAIISVVITGIFCKISIEKIEKLSDTKQNATNSEVGPVEGYGRITNVAREVINDVEDSIENKIINIFVFYVPTIIACGIVILQVIASLLQAKKENKRSENASKICTYISMCLLVVLCISVLWNVVVTYSSTTLSINKIMLAVALITNIVSLVVYVVEISKIKKNDKINING